MQSTMNLGAPRASRTGDALDRHYTPDDLAGRCLDALMDLWRDEYRIWFGGPRGFHPPFDRDAFVVVEGQVGGGSFARQVRRTWPNASLIGCDIDEDAVGLDTVDLAHVGDWVDFAGTLADPDLVIGNPPFSTRRQSDRDRATRCVLAAVDLTRAPKDRGHRPRRDPSPSSLWLSAQGAWVALILPAVWVVGGSSFDWLREERSKPSHVIPLHPRPWGNSVRETALHVWAPEEIRRTRGWRDPVISTRRIEWVPGVGSSGGGHAPAGESPVGPGGDNLERVSACDTPSGLSSSAGGAT